MDLLLDLWLAILAAGVAVFFCGFISHVVLPLHKKDFDKVPNEDAFLAAMKQLNTPPGFYFFPQMAMGKEGKDPKNIEAMKSMPMGTMTIWNGMPNMGKNMLLTFAWNALASLLIAYLASVTLPRGAEFSRVLQVAGTAGVLAHTIAQMPNQIWYGAKTSTKIACIIDGLLSGVVTGLVFAALWPK
jgi:Na+/H+ antiporter NhaA